MTRWLRLHADFVDNPKVQRLELSLFKALIIVVPSLSEQRRPAADRRYRIQAADEAEEGPTTAQRTTRSGASRRR